MFQLGCCVWYPPICVGQDAGVQAPWNAKGLYQLEPKIGGVGTVNIHRKCCGVKEIETSQWFFNPFSLTSAEGS
eukprot:12915740-Prorocentrum_lima.AAC.1